MQNEEILYKIDVLIPRQTHHTLGIRISRLKKLRIYCWYDRKMYNYEILYGMYVSISRPTHHTSTKMIAKLKRLRNHRWYDREIYNGEILYGRMFEYHLGLTILRRKWYLNLKGCEIIGDVNMYDDTFFECIFEYHVGLTTLWIKLYLSLKTSKSSFTRYLLHIQVAWYDLM